MPLTDGDWKRIQNAIAGFSRTQPSDFFVQGEVVKVDSIRKVIFMAEFGDQPIPIFAFNYDVKTLDTQKNGRTKVRMSIAHPRLPKKGAIVLVAKHMGTRRLPKCLGVLRSKNFVEVGED